MTQAISVSSIRPAESRVIAGVCAAHFVSHYYMLLLAPLFAFVVLASGTPLTADMGREHYELIHALEDLDEPEFTQVARKTLAGFAGRWLTAFHVDEKPPSTEPGDPPRKSR